MDPLDIYPMYWSLYWLLRDSLCRPLCEPMYWSLYASLHRPWESALDTRNKHRQQTQATSTNPAIGGPKEQK